MAADYMAHHLTVTKALKNINTSKLFGRAWYILGDIHRLDKDNHWCTEDEDLWDHGGSFDIEIAADYYWGDAEMLKRDVYRRWINGVYGDVEWRRPTAILLQEHYTREQVAAGDFTEADNRLLTLLSIVGDCHYVPTVRRVSCNWQFLWDGSVSGEEITEVFTRFANEDIEAIAAREPQPASPWECLEIISVHATAGTTLDYTSEDDMTELRFEPSFRSGHRRVASSYCTVLVCEYHPEPPKAPHALPLLPWRRHCGLIAVMQLHRLGEANADLASDWTMLPLEVMFYFVEVAFDVGMAQIFDEWEEDDGDEEEGEYEGDYEEGEGEGEGDY